MTDSLKGLSGSHEGERRAALRMLKLGGEEGKIRQTWCLLNKCLFFF